MNCHKFRRKIHEFLDGELPPREFSTFRKHLNQCAQCRQEHDEFIWVKGALPFQRLSPSLQRQLWKGVERRVEDALWIQPAHLWDNWRTFWRDLDRRVVWSKLAAVPVTLAFFVLILVQFEPVNLQQWTYPMMATVSAASSSSAEPITTQVPVRFSGVEIDHLMSAVWELPFEDSLSLVAEITPEGYAQIEDVLEYPKSQALLTAINLTLRGSQFEMTPAQSLDAPFVIYSFQKVDVYEDHRGL
ncbi:zf-HC2 domain-containing protein [Acidobacteria bacterium AH-259-D05]|nr:zf-HC2 domain-containing protein [Acidobacteria bacterium AH-259-D05]